MGASSNYQKPTTHRSREVSNSKAAELRQRRKISALQETARLGIHHVVDILQCVWVDGSAYVQEVVHTKPKKAVPTPSVPTRRKSLKDGNKVKSLFGAKKDNK